MLNGLQVGQWEEVFYDDNRHLGVPASSTTPSVSSLPVTFRDGLHVTKEVPVQYSVVFTNTYVHGRCLQTDAMMAEVLAQWREQPQQGRGQSFNSAL